MTHGAHTYAYASTSFFIFNKEIHKSSSYSDNISSRIERTKTGKGNKHTEYMHTINLISLKLFFFLCSLFFLCWCRAHLAGPTHRSTNHVCICFALPRAMARGDPSPHGGRPAQCLVMVMVVVERCRCRHDRRRIGIRQPPLYQATFFSSSDFFYSRWQNMLKSQFILGSIAISHYVRKQQTLFIPSSVSPSFFYYSNDISAYARLMMAHMLTSLCVIGIDLCLPIILLYVYVCMCGWVGGCYKCRAIRGMKDLFT